VRTRASVCGRARRKRLETSTSRLEMIRSGDIHPSTGPTLGDVSRATSTSIR